MVVRSGHGAEFGTLTIRGRIVAATDGYSPSLGAKPDRNGEYRITRLKHAALGSNEANRA